MCGHLAAAVQTPGVFLYGQRSNVFCWRPFHPCCEIIVPSYEEEMEVYRTNKRRYSSLHCIQAETVFEKICEMLTGAESEKR